MTTPATQEMAAANPAVYGLRRWDDISPTAAQPAAPLAEIPTSDAYS
jgi:hypothetical protein